MNDVLIKAENLSYKYPFQSEEALHDISFTLRRGEAMLVTGASGCGKSTLLRILNGLIPEHFRGTLGGELEIAGHKAPATIECISRHVGTVLQCPEEQILATTVEEEVAIALEWRSTPQREMRSLVDDALRVLDLTHLAARSVFTLSSGERQKCVIASVLAAKADIVVMDEPTANLSPEATEELAAIVADLKKSGVAVVIVDHRLYWLKGVVDKVLVLKAGRAVATIDGNRLDSSAIDPSWGLRGIDVKRPELPAVPRDCDKAVEVQNLSFRYGRRLPFIYEGFSCAIPRGKTTAIVGANGAGKTTLARLLCGLVKPSAGHIILNEVPGSWRLADKKPSNCQTVKPSNCQTVKPSNRQTVKLSNCQTVKPSNRQTSFVMQQMDIQLYMKTVMDELMYSAPRGIRKSERAADAAKWLDVFGLAHLKDRHPHSLSGGEKQRLVVACALMKRPKLMILDEPTSGLDGRNMRIIADVLKDYASSGGTVLLITHDLELLKLAADFKLEI